MATLIELDAQLASLKAARASGALIVKHGDTQVTYRSITELEAAIAAVIGEINGLAGKKRRPRYILQTSKGL